MTPPPPINDSTRRRLRSAHPQPRWGWGRSGGRYLTQFLPAAFAEYSWLSARS